MGVITMKVPRLGRSRINYAGLLGLYKNHGPKQFARVFQEALFDGSKRPEDFSIQALAEVCFPDWREWCDPGADLSLIPEMREAAVDSTAFSNINGQLLINKLIQGFTEADQGIFDKLCTVVPTRFNGERIVGITPPANEDFDISEGMPYDEGGVSEDWYDTPVTTKHGQIIKVTKEAVFYDLTGQLLRKAQAIGERAATARLKRILRVVLGITNNFKWKNTSYNTYYLTGGGGPWVNDLASNNLVDWLNIEKGYLQMTEILEPTTGNPIEQTPDSLLVMPFKGMTANQILTATQVWKNDGASNTPVTLGSNPVAGMLTNIVVSAIAKQLLVNEGGKTGTQADNTWIMGTFKKAFWYMENWPLTPASLQGTSEMAFFTDTIAAFKISERGVAWSAQPQYVQRNPG